MAFLFYFGFMNWICLNGKMLSGERPVLMHSNRGFRYGDALFETMKIFNGKIILLSYHYERLFSGLRILHFKGISTLSKRNLSESILELCQRNRCSDLGRVRLTVFRGNGSLNDKEENLQYLIEAVALPKTIIKLNEKGFHICLHPEVKKSCDIFSNLKSANYLPYVVAAQFAKSNKQNDCLICNTNGRLADTSIANLFLIKEKMIITPALAEGCVNGVMRRYLLDQLKMSNKFDVREGAVTLNDLKDFEEVFLTNAIYGIRWVRRFENKLYRNSQTVSIYKELIEPLHS
ncbi:MAG TPA: aminotransferase class IV [Chitinophagaceae bacterium]|nr:aminotransferase class IV [Chitinophagaceae bacterium]